MCKRVHSTHFMYLSILLMACAKLDYYLARLLIFIFNFSGQSFTEEQQDEICENWIERWSDLCMQYWDLHDAILSQGGENDPRIPGPLKVLPETTYPCITRQYCYHREYMTNDTSQSKFRSIHCFYPGSSNLWCYILICYVW